MPLLTAYPTTTAVDANTIFPLTEADGKVKTITAPALATALAALAPPTGGSGGPIVGVAPSFSVPALSTWTTRNPNDGNTTVTQPIAGGPIVFEASVNGVASDMQLATTPAPSEPWTKTWLLEWDSLDVNNQSAFLVLFNSATGGVIWMGFDAGTMYCQYWSNLSSPSTSTLFSFNAQHFGAYWWRVQNDGTTLTFSISKNNVRWQQVGTVALSTPLGGVTDIGVGITNASNQNPSLVYVWNLG